MAFASNFLGPFLSHFFFLLFFYLKLPLFLPQFHHRDLLYPPPQSQVSALSRHCSLTRCAEQHRCACARVCVCDHHASSQVKIGALFILLGPVILTKRQQRKKPRSGGNRVETGWRRASLAAHLLITHASVSATYCTYTAVLTHIVRTSQLVLLWSGGEKHLKWAGLLFFWSCCAEGIDFQMCFYTFPHFSKLHLS